MCLPGKITSGLNERNWSVYFCQTLSERIKKWAYRQLLRLTEHGTLQKVHKKRVIKGRAQSFQYRVCVQRLSWSLLSPAEIIAKEDMESDLPNTKGKHLSRQGWKGSASRSGFYRFLRVVIADLQSSALRGSKIQSMIREGKQVMAPWQEDGRGCWLHPLSQDCTTVSITTSYFHVPWVLQNADLWGYIFPCLLPAPKVNSFRNSKQNLFRDHGYYFWLLPGQLAWGRLNNNWFVPLSYNKSHHPSCEGEN